MKKPILLIIMALVIQGCGTLQTLPAKGHIEISHRGYKSHCKAIPKVYSGTFFQICKFFGEPNYEEDAGLVESDFYLLTIDILLSFGLDTVVLPYTATMQYKYGSTSAN